MEIIMKYNNRKLYSTAVSAYVSLDYIVELVKSNQKFQVIESSSKLDITKKILRSTMSDLPLSLETMTMLIRGN
jgi:polyhydroxyalkanoate synthesis regulator protein